MKNASGSLFGLAYGDSLGKPTEFQDYATIVAAYGPGGPRELTGEPALVTDDTQMMLAVGEALVAAGPVTPQSFEPVLRQAFLDWAISPDNNRAPGMTCLRACGDLADGRPWQQASQLHSKGCGANMRVTPVGLVPGLSDEQLAGAAQLQAGLTHGHPTGLAASELTALAVRRLRDGLEPQHLPAVLRDHCAEQRLVYHGDWLGDLWRRPGVRTPEDFIATGWDECAAALDRVADALRRDDDGGDPCLLTGEGWIAEEALATALYCYLLTPDEPVTALGRAAASSGDSDSIACLAGGLAGAALGLAAWPAPWSERIEYADRLRVLGAAWDQQRDIHRPITGDHHRPGLNGTMQNLLPEPPATRLPFDTEADTALAEATRTGTDDAYKSVAARFPAFSGGWAALAQSALADKQPVTAYAYARTGYHRGLDALRRNGWKGHGPVPWSHVPNQGFLRCLHTLSLAAAEIGESDEAARCAQFLRDSDPAAADALT